MSEYTQAEVDAYVVGKNLEARKQLEERQEAYQALLASKEATDAQLAELRSTVEVESGKLQALEMELEESAAVEAEYNRLEAETAYYKGEYEAAERASMISSAAAKYGAIDRDVLGAVLADVATPDIDATVAAMRENRAEFGSLFKSEAVPGIGQSTNPPPQSQGGKPTAQQLRHMSTERYMELRAKHGPEFFGLR